MLAIQVPTWMRRVAAPMSCAVAMTSLLTSAAKIASKPASSASRAIVWISLARQPTPGMTANPSRSAIGVSFSRSTQPSRAFRYEAHLLLSVTPGMPHAPAVPFDVPENLRTGLRSVLRACRIVKPAPDSELEPIQPDPQIRLRPTLLLHVEAVARRSRHRRRPPQRRLLG